MDEFVKISLLIFGGMFLGSFAGFAAESNAWERDCTKIGAHVSNGKVYQCSERKQ